MYGLVTFYALPERELNFLSRVNHSEVIMGTCGQISAIAYSLYD